MSASELPRSMELEQLVDEVGHNQLPNIRQQVALIRGDAERFVKLLARLTPSSTNEPEPYDPQYVRDHLILTGLVQLDANYRRELQELCTAPRANPWLQLRVLAAITAVANSEGQQELRHTVNATLNRWHCDYMQTHLLHQAARSHPVIVQLLSKTLTDDRQVQTYTAMVQADHSLIRSRVVGWGAQQPKLLTGFLVGDVACPVGTIQSGEIVNIQQGNAVVVIENLNAAGMLQNHNLAQAAGVEVQTRTPSTAEQRMVRLRELLTTAASYFHDRLLHDDRAEAARAYLVQRGVTAAGTTSFGLGYAPPGWDELLHHLKEQGHRPGAMVEAGVVSRSAKGYYHDHFRERLIFPIRDVHGQVVSFGGRRLAEEQRGPKYLNGPATTLFDKSSVLYGIDLAAPWICKEDQVVVVEGYLDATIAQQQGQSNVVATLGTTLTDKHITILKKLTRHIVIALDGDHAGDVAALRNAQALLPLLTSEGRGTLDLAVGPRLAASIRIASLPAGQDPDEVIKDSVAAWQAIVAGAKPIVEHCFALARTRHDLESAGGRRAIADWLIPLLAVVTDEVERNAYVQQLAGLIDTPVSIVRRRVEAARVSS